MREARTTSCAHHQATNIHQQLRHTPSFLLVNTRSYFADSPGMLPQLALLAAAPAQPPTDLQLKLLPGTTHCLDGESSARRTTGS